MGDEPSVVDQMPTVLSPKQNAHYGNPAGGCLDDEHVVELAEGHACMPKISSTVGANGLPVPKCRLGIGNAIEQNSGCPHDAQVPFGSKALPLCLDKSNSTDPYVNG